MRKHSEQRKAALITILLQKLTPSHDDLKPKLLSHCEMKHSTHKQRMTYMGQPQSSFSAHGPFHCYP